MAGIGGPSTSDAAIEDDEEKYNDYHCKYAHNRWNLFIKKSKTHRKIHRYGYGFNYI